MTNEQIVQKIQDCIDIDDNLGLLYQQNIRYIRKVVKPFAKNEMDLEDLMQECYFAIEQAAYDYDFEGGASFLTYATYKIWACCTTYIRKNRRIHISAQALERISRYRKISEKYLQEHGELPSDKYIMEQMNLTQKEYDKLIKAVAACYVQSIYKQIGSDDEDFTIYDTISSKEDIEADFIQNDLNRALWEQVEHLDDPRKTLIINRLYKEDKTQLQVANELRISVGRVGQIERTTLNILKSRNEVQEAAQYYGYDSHSAYGYTTTRFKQTGMSSVEFLALKHIEQQEEMEKLNNAFDEIMQMA